MPRTHGPDFKTAPLSRQVRADYCRQLLPLSALLLEAIHQGFAHIHSGSERVALKERLKADAVGKDFRRMGKAWADAVNIQLEQACGRVDVAAQAAAQAPAKPQLQLLDTAVLEREILAARMVAAFMHENSDWQELCLRLKALEQGQELAADDIFQPSRYAGFLLKAWMDLGLSHQAWGWVEPSVQAVLHEKLAQAISQCNQLLKQAGVSADPGYAHRIRNRPDQDRSKHLAAEKSHDPDRKASDAGFFAQVQAPVRWSDRLSPSQLRTFSSAAAAQAGAQDASRSADEMTAFIPQHARDETRTLLADFSPTAYVQRSGQAVWLGLRRLLAEHAVDIDPEMTPTALSPLLQVALTAPDPASEQIADAGQASGQALSRMADRLHEHAQALKKKTDKANEKAIIEIVALMFQAILSEDRIPASMRLWFARLQLPVLRLALTEPEFFASAEHPARRLIDRMGACAMGFEDPEIQGSQLEAEFKRIVQVVEQYPETGRRVYVVVLRELKKFLGHSLTQTRAQMASLAQQVEQKEALAVQYMIEMRKLLDSVVVDEGVRTFLFHVWSDVLAMAAVRHGAQHEKTLQLKQTATHLLWASSPRIAAAERSQVVRQMAGLLQQLRAGMSSLALPQEDQDRHIRQISAAVMHAFNSPQALGLDAEKLHSLSRALAALEDVVHDDPEGEMRLDPAIVNVMAGESDLDMQVIATGGARPDAAMLHQARHIELGSWFTLQHENHLLKVQYAWHSQRKQLHLFSQGSYRAYLFQTQRLAAYLQAGLLLPLEDESLTVRATRDALQKLRIRPEQLT